MKWMKQILRKKGGDAESKIRNYNFVGLKIKI